MDDKVKDLLLRINDGQVRKLFLDLHVINIDNLRHGVNVCFLIILMLALSGFLIICCV